MKSLTFLPLLFLMTGCGATATTFVKAPDTTLGRVVVYRNGVAYFERTAEVEGDHLNLSVPSDKVDDFLKSLTVVDAQTGQPAPISYPTKQVSFIGEGVEGFPGAWVPSAPFAQVVDALLCLLAKDAPQPNPMTITIEADPHTGRIGLQTVNERFGMPVGPLRRALEGGGGIWHWGRGAICATSRHGLLAKRARSASAAKPAWNTTRMSLPAVADDALSAL